jgi:hypothetical protein|tara:strand:- start:857 stop:1087 length:231 start_codon:yes stop_codon:yes gene_type:complete
MKIVLYFIIAAALAMIVAHVADAKNNTLGKTGCDGFPKARAVRPLAPDVLGGQVRPRCGDPLFVHGLSGRPGCGPR